MRSKNDVMLGLQFIRFVKRSIKTFRDFCANYPTESIDVITPEKVYEQQLRDMAECTKDAATTLWS